MHVLRATCAERRRRLTCSARTGLMAAVLEGCTSGATMRQLAWHTTLLTCKAGKESMQWPHVTVLYRQATRVGCSSCI